MSAARFEHPVAGMSQAELPTRLRRALESAQRELPPKTGVTLFVFDFGSDGGIGYISNAERGDFVRALREWLHEQEKRS